MIVMWYQVSGVIDIITTFSIGGGGMSSTHLTTPTPHHKLHPLTHLGASRPLSTQWCVCPPPKEDTGAAGIRASCQDHQTEDPEAAGEGI